MSHINEDQLLLYAWGELPEGERELLEAHLRACAECRARFTAIEESRVALDWGLEIRTRPRIPRLAWLALPLAAGIGALLLWRGTPPRSANEMERPVWQPHLVGSSTAGYVTGGDVLMTIDAQLTRLEQRRMP